MNLLEQGGCILIPLHTLRKQVIVSPLFGEEKGKNERSLSFISNAMDISKPVLWEGNTALSPRLLAFWIGHFYTYEYLFIELCKNSPIIGWLRNPKSKGSDLSNSSSSSCYLRAVKGLTEMPLNGLGSAKGEQKPWAQL